MSDLLTVLEDEHRVIERVLDALERYAAAAAAGEPCDPADLGAFTEVCRELVDGVHHGKEEDLLFAALVEDGLVPPDQGPLALLDEHEQGRRAVATLAELAEGGRFGPAERKTLLATVTTYARMLRAHIRTEDTGLYPVARERLEPRTLDVLTGQGEAFDDAHGSADWLARGEALAERFGDCGNCDCHSHAVP